LQAELLPPAALVAHLAEDLDPDLISAEDN